jgi:hypothetical protein
MARSKKKSKTKAKKPAKVSKVHPNSDGALRQELAGLFERSHAHVSLKPALAGVPVEIRGVTPAGAPHSLWQLLEHLRIAQWDILEFSRDSKHVSPDWPSGYWPAAGVPPNDREWEKSLHAFEHELSEFRKLVLDPKTDLFAKIPHGTGQTILREALLLADHNAYHIGQFVIVRRLLGAWHE